MDLVERLKAIISYTDFSDRAFAIKCGIKQPTLDKQLRRLRAVSIETILAVCTTFPEISVEWLMKGEGNMLKSQNKEDTERMLKLLDTIATLQATINAQSDTINVLTERIKQLEN
ncbi:MAG: XRE family transcriptional regulator [Muribaculaceae bacterium]|nr:XRE family transcriptional regulator [Muribaculaceae bacterium]